MGPLEGVKILEIAGIGPGPFAAMMLSDMGAEVLRIDRVQNVGRRGAEGDLLARNRRNVAVDLKSRGGVETVLKLVAGADALLEGFRPGVMERLGLGPEVCLERNPRLVYGRMTGWGQEGPLATAAGHDINYIALAGALDPIGRRGQPPLPPLNLVGDFGGGGMFLAFGIVCGLVERVRSGKGQVVDAAMVDGASVLMTMMHTMRAWGAWNDERGTNLLDTGAHFYEVYETKDGGYISIGSIEPQFYRELLEKTGLADEELPQQMDRTQWDNLKVRLSKIFKTRTRSQWCEIMEGTDICFAPVLSMEDAPDHAHLQHRKTFQEAFGIVQPSPAPRFSRTPPEISRAPAATGEHTDEALADWGFEQSEIATLREQGAIA